MHSCRRPHRARAFAGGYPYASTGDPLPARAFTGIPMHFCRRPPPRTRFHRDTRALLPAVPAPPAPSQGDTRTLLPAPPPRTRPSLADTHTLLPAVPAPPAPFAGIPVHFCRHPHPARACGAPPPPPPRGRWQCVAISGKQPYPGCSRRTAVPGSSPGSPHVLDRGDIATGGGADGEGACPLPCLLRSLNSEYLTDPVRVPCRWLPKELAGTPAPHAPFAGGYPDTSPATPTPPAPS